MLVLLKKGLEVIGMSGERPRRCVRGEWQHLFGTRFLFLREREGERRKLARPLREELYPTGARADGPRLCRCHDRAPCPAACHAVHQRRRYRVTLPAGAKSNGCGEGCGAAHTCYDERRPVRGTPLTTDHGSIII